LAQDRMDKGHVIMVKGFRFQWGNPWGFEPPLRTIPNQELMSLASTGLAHPPLQPDQIVTRRGSAPLGFLDRPNIVQMSQVCRHCRSLNR
jgi:hypothetical protein